MLSDNLRIPINTHGQLRNQGVSAFDQTFHFQRTNFDDCIQSIIQEEGSNVDLNIIRTHQQRIRLLPRVNALQHIEKKSHGQRFLNFQHY